MLTVMAAVRLIHGMDGSAAIGVALGGALAGMALLWFRRSRRNEPKPEREPADSPHVEKPRDSRSDSGEAPHDVESPQPGPPGRIRGLLLLNLLPADGTDQIEHAPPLGTREAVIRAIQTVAPGIRFDETGRGELGGNDHFISIDLGRDEPVYAAVASAEGDIGIEMLRALIERQHWRAYAARAGVFVEPDALDLFALPDSVTSPKPPAGRF